MSVITSWGLKHRDIITSFEICGKVTCSTWMAISYFAQDTPPSSWQKLFYQRFLSPFLFSFHLHSPTNPHPHLVSKCLWKSDSLPCLNHTHTELQMIMVFCFWMP